MAEESGDPESPSLYVEADDQKIVVYLDNEVEGSKREAVAAAVHAALGLFGLDVRPVIAIKVSPEELAEKSQAVHRDPKRQGKPIAGARILPHGERP